MSTKTLAIINIILDTLVLVGLLFSHLALTDIGHGVEPDLTTKRCVLRISFLLTLGLAISSLASARAVLQK